MLNLFGKERRGKKPDHLGLTPAGFHVAPDVKASVHSDGMVLLHIGRGTVFSANRIGAIVWNGVAERWSLDRVAAFISNEFHVAAQTARQDAAEFLAQLAAEGLLVANAN